MNRNETLSILKELNHSPNKKLGQNFLVDNNVLDKIISASDLKKNDIVLEIGAGLGALTSELIKSVEKVYSYEIDKILYRYLKNKFSSFSNLELFNQDILKADIPPHNKVISNIPYSITGPILEKVFYNNSPPSGILIIEKSLADRIFAKSNYKNFSRISVSFNAFMKPLRRFSISPNSFYPSPKIELSMINVYPKKDLDPFLKSEQGRAFFLKFIGGIMPYKNKNLSNAIISYLNAKKEIKLSKEDIINYLDSISFDDLKVSSYKYDNFIVLSEAFHKILKKIN